MLLQVAQEQSEAADGAAVEVKKHCDEASEALKAAQDDGEDIAQAETDLKAALDEHAAALAFSDEARQHMRAALAAAEVAESARTSVTTQVSRCR